MPRTVLIVDDSTIERAILTKLLEKEYHIKGAADGEEALKLLHQNFKTISAVILDLVMPKMDGYAVLQKIRSNPFFLQIPVIVATAMTDEEARAHAMSLGANGFVTKPYDFHLLTSCLQNLISLRENAALVNTLRNDKLTGLLNRDTFFQESERLIRRHEPGYYVMACLDIENFKIINDQYGTEVGDRVLRHIAECIGECVRGINGLACRSSADCFAVLYPAQFRNSELVLNKHKLLTTPDCIKRKIRVRVGRCIVDDCTVKANNLYDRATIAQESIKNRYDIYIAEYDDSMRVTLLREQQIVNDMDHALESGQFEPWFQPQYNHVTGALIGAEALVRWKKDDVFIPPNEFIPVFERNGFIYEMDQYIWTQVCRLLRCWLDEGRSPVPISVNISRRDLFHQHFIPVLTSIVKKYQIPYDLLRLEVTESAFADSTKVIENKVDQLIELGFTVEIDDFGSGYSSLNTLKDVPASILKLDMKFFENTKNTQRGGNIIESVVRMAKWLGMTVIAEGVEHREQADYLKSIGCNYIQGYYYARPMPLAEYEQLMDASGKEPKVTRLETLVNLDNSEFWNPKSMETLILTAM